MRDLIFLALFPLLIAGLMPLADSVAGDLYVNNTIGDDHFTGRQPTGRPDGSGPVRSIGRALALAQEGDQVHVANTGHAYRESITLMGSHNSGSGSVPFVLAGGGAVLDGAAPVPVGRWENYRQAVFRFAPPRVEFQQLFLSGRPAARVLASAASTDPYFCRSHLPNSPSSSSICGAGIVSYGLNVQNR